MVAFGTVVVAALAGAPHCLGMCGPFACAAGPRGPGQVAYHAARIATYAALGALSGAFGSAIPGPPWVGTALGAALLVWFSLVLAGVLPEPHVAIPGLRGLGAKAVARTDVGSRAVLGFVNGLLPCGLVWATLSVAVAAADPWRGAALLAVFGLFTTPVLLASVYGMRRIVAGSPRTRRALAVVVLVAGLWSLAFRSGAAAAIGLVAAPTDPSTPPCHADH